MKRQRKASSCATHCSTAEGMPAKTEAVAGETSSRGLSGGSNSSSLLPLSPLPAAGSRPPRPSYSAEPLPLASSSSSTAVTGPSRATCGPGDRLEGVPRRSRLPDAARVLPPPGTRADEEEAAAEAAAASLAARISARLLPAGSRLARLEARGVPREVKFSTRGEGTRRPAGGAAAWE
jgi:hypothetical protein